LDRRTPAKMRGRAALRRLFYEMKMSNENMIESAV
jgi:hypothetical protein